MKLDASLGTEGGYLKEIDRTARAAEDLGFAGLWTSETKHDAFLPLAIAANETQAVELGTSVAIAFSRSPMETAQTAWDLQDLSDGRLLLGLGTQVKAHITRRFSMPWDRPAARLREYILALRAIWESFQTGEALRFEGEFYQHTLMTPFFDPGPMDHPEIPIYIAGVNTRLARSTCGRLSNRP
jgi:probable F420-dependent oxidoreductase